MGTGPLMILSGSREHLLQIFSNLDDLAGASYVNLAVEVLLTRVMNEETVH